MPARHPRACLWRGLQEPRPPVQNSVCPPPQRAVPAAPGEEERRAHGASFPWEAVGMGGVAGRRCCERAQRCCLQEASGSRLGIELHVALALLFVKFYFSLRKTRLVRRRIWRLAQPRESHLLSCRCGH